MSEEGNGPGGVYAMSPGEREVLMVVVAALEKPFNQTRIELAKRGVREAEIVAAFARFIGAQFAAMGIQSSNPRILIEAAAEMTKCAAMDLLHLATAKAGVFNAKVVDAETGGVKELSAEELAAHIERSQRKETLQ